MSKLKHNADYRDSCWNLQQFNHKLNAVELTNGLEKERLDVKRWQPTQVIANGKCQVKVHTSFKLYRLTTTSKSVCWLELGLQFNEFGSAKRVYFV